MYPPSFSVANFQVPDPQKNFRTLRRLIYKQRPDLDTSETWFLNVNLGIGDAFTVLGFLRAFRETHECARLVIISRPSLSPLTTAYRHAFDYCVFLNLELNEISRQEARFGPNELIFSSKSYVYNGHWVNFAVANRVPVFDWYKLGLRLPMRSKFDMPNWSFLDEIKLPLNFESTNPNKTAILFPNLAYGPRIEPDYWERVHRVLSSNGFLVFTNMGNKVNSALAPKRTNELICGTIPIDCDLVSLLAFVKRGATCVLANGGMLLVIATLGQPTYVLYRDDVVSSDDLNSSFIGEFWTPSMSHDSIRRNMPFCKVDELTANEEGLSSLAKLFPRT